MANPNKKIINTWDGGVLTTKRDTNPNTSYGAQEVKDFEIYRDPTRLIPMQDWENFTTLAERQYNIRAMGGISDTVYGLGSGLSNWMSANWSHRIKINIDPNLCSSNSFPLQLNLADMPSDFWSHIKEDGSDIRITNESHTIIPFHVENFDFDNQAGQIWFKPSIESNVLTTTTQDYSTPSVNIGDEIDRSGKYAIAFPVTLTKSFNKISLKAYRVGTGATMQVDLYTKSGNNPDTLVQNIGSMSISHITTSTSGEVVTFYLPSGIDLAGDYMIVVTSPDADTTNYFHLNRSDAGTQTVVYATNSALTAWSLQDSSATPYFINYLLESSLDDIHFYVYYGNSGTQEITYGESATPVTNGGRQVFTDFRFFYTFGDLKANNKPFEDNDTGEDEAFTSDPIYNTEDFGNSIIKPGSISTHVDDNIRLSSDNISVSVAVYLIELPASETQIASDLAGDWYISITTSGQIKFYTEATGTSTSTTSTSSIVAGRWYTIDVKHSDADRYIYINGVLDKFSDDNDGDYNVGSQTGNAISLNCSNFAKLAVFGGYNGALSEDAFYTKHNNLFDSYFFSSIGSEEDIGDVNLQYTGFQLYEKSISSGDWSESESSGQPIKSTGRYPVNGFVSDLGDYFVISQEPENEGFLYLAKVESTTVVDTSHLILSVVDTDSKTVVQSDTPTDRTTYFHFGSTSLGSVGDPGSNNEITLGGILQSITPWRDYLGIGYNVRNRAFLDVWDLADTIVTERVDCGNGNIRIVGNASDILFAVIDNFTDDAVKSSNRPTVEVHQYVGNGQSSKTHEIEVPAVVTSYTDAWERAVSNFKVRRNTQTLFYARIPKNAGATEFNEGLWAIGKNSQGRLSLTLQISTDGLGMPENIFGLAQQVFFIQKDGNIKKLSDSTYTKTSSYRTLKMNEGNTEIEKKLKGVEIVTEPLASGQVVSVFYRINGEDTDTKILEISGEGEISKESLYEFETENNFKNYKEIEFLIQSTGGKSAILELNYSYEYLSDIV